MRSHTGLLAMAGFLAAANGAWAEDTSPIGDGLRAFDVFQECDVCPEMIVLPLGAFQMGSSVDEANEAHMRFFANANIDPAPYKESLSQAFAAIGIDPDHPEDGLLAYYASGNVIREQDPQYSENPFLHEVPKHQVTIDRRIAMGRNEVTRAEWVACVQDGGCERGLQEMPPAAWAACQNADECAMTPDNRVRFRLPDGPHATHPRSPMTGITFQEMHEYTAWLNEKVGADVYRAPTEAEWEYAARAGTVTRFAQGDTLTLAQGNFMVARRDLVEGAYVWDFDLGSARALLPVDELDAANGWGLRHMSGNASEFTSTCGEGPHRALASSSAYPAADKDRPDCRRAVKGGMEEGNVELARPARRVDLPVDYWSPSMGFRVLRDMARGPGGQDLP